MNLQERLQSELIGEDVVAIDNSDQSVWGEDYKLQHDAQVEYGNHIKHHQRNALPKLATTIAADLKGMLPKKKPMPDTDRMMMDGFGLDEVEQEQVAVVEYNAAVRDCTAAIDRYTGVNELNKEA